jgi:predicted RNase H-like nuclease (RuvC/YqgF family)
MLKVQIKDIKRIAEDLKKDKLLLKKEKKALVTQVELLDKKTSEALRQKASTEIDSKKDSTKFEKKIQMYQHEIKKQETEIFKIKKQMTKILDDKTTFSNSYMEVKSSSDMKRIAKICDKYRSDGNIEFVEMLKNGFDSTYNVLVEENSSLRS